MASGPSQIGGERLFLGDRKQAKDRALLRSLGVRSILNCTPPRSVDSAAGCPNFFEAEASMTYKRVPIFDTPAEDAGAHAAGAAAWIGDRLHHGAVFVHCHRGVSRSATFVCAYLMKSRGLDAAAALALVRATRPAAKPNAAFARQLDAYGKTLEDARAAAARRRGDAAPAPAPAPAPAAAARPAIGPARPDRAPAIGPARPDRAPAIGPARGPVAGPARPPAAAAAARVAGPQLPPKRPAPDDAPAAAEKRAKPGA